MSVYYLTVAITCDVNIHDHPEHFPPLNSCDTRDSQQDWLTPPLSLSIFSVLPERVLLIWPFGRKPHRFVNYAININKAEEAFMVSLPRARDVSWHHHTTDDWWKLSGCISWSAILEENGVVIKRYDCTHGCLFLIGTIWNGGSAHRII